MTTPHLSHYLRPYSALKYSYATISTLLSPQFYHINKVHTVYPTPGPLWRPCPPCQCKPLCTSLPPTTALWFPTPSSCHPPSPPSSAILVGAYQGVNRGIKISIYNIAVVFTLMEGRFHFQGWDSLLHLPVIPPSLPLLPFWKGPTKE